MFRSKSDRCWDVLPSSSPRLERSRRRRVDGDGSDRVVGVETFYHPLHRMWNGQDSGESTVMEVIGVETFYHPLQRVWNGQDGGESTVMEVIGVETFYHPLHRVWNGQDGGESTVMEVIGVETFYHPLQRVWNGQDGGESTVMEGDWTTSTRSERVHHQHRRQLVSIVRCFETPTSHCMMTALVMIGLIIIIIIIIGVTSLG